METLVRVSTLENEVEANAVDAALTAEAIPHVIQSFHDSAYDGVFQPQKGWGLVLAPAHHVDQVREVVQRLREGEQALEEDQTRL